MKIAILTSGDDSPGMNALVRCVVKFGVLKECEVWVVREGYEGLVRGNIDAEKSSLEVDATKVDATNEVQHRQPDHNLLDNLRFGDGSLLRDGTSEVVGGRSLKGRYIVRVGWDDVRGWFSAGGTLIGSSRSESFMTAEGRTAAAYNLIKEGIDALIVCGGDGSLTGADVFRSEWPGIIYELHVQGKITTAQLELHHHLRLVAVVGTVDNDMSLTDFTIGASTALQRVCDAIDNINSTAYSHSRAFVVEVMGGHCGWLALEAGVAGGADFIFLPERPPKAMPWEDEMCAEIHRHRKMGKRKTIVIVAEGAHDSLLQPIRAEDVKNALTDRLGLDTHVISLGHTQRGGPPCAFDRILATLQGVEAVEALLEAQPGTPTYMIGLQGNKITRVPLMDAVEITRAVGKAVQARDFDKALELRGSEFKETLDNFCATSMLAVKEACLPEDKRIRVGIMNIGSPACGVNAATRAVVRYCVNQGHIPLGIHNSFSGLLDDNVDELSWLGVDAWTARGGSELGTNHDLPSIDLGAVASKFQQFHFGALLIIGGFGGFCSLQILEEGRKLYPAFNIPMVHLPATFTNHVPMTDFCVGSDTSLNALVDACEAIKQSATANRNRVFLIETPAMSSGYLATMGALAVGASLLYIPETGITLDMLKRDIRFLKKRFSLEVPGKNSGRLVMISEGTSPVYSTSVLTKMLQEEGGKLFDARSASLGHTLQGGVPSAIDRARAVRLSLKCMAFIEEHVEIKRKTQRVEPESAAVITIQSSSIKWVPVQEMVHQADVVNRRGKSAWWHDLTPLLEELTGRSHFLKSQTRDST